MSVKSGLATNSASISGDGDNLRMRIGGAIHVAGTLDGGLNSI